MLHDLQQVPFEPPLRLPYSLATLLLITTTTTDHRKRG